MLKYLVIQCILKLNNSIHDRNHTAEKILSWHNFLQTKIRVIKTIPITFFSKENIYGLI